MIPRAGWLLAGLVVTAAWAGSGRAADADAAGNWVLGFFDPEKSQMVTPWLVRIEKQGDKWSASVLDAVERTVPIKSVENVTVAGDVLRFEMKTADQPFSFEGKLPPDKSKKILGTFALGSTVVPAELQATRMKKFDAYEMAKELVARDDAGLELFNVVQFLLKGAGERNVRLAEARGWANRAFAQAEHYGPRWQREVALQLAAACEKENGFEPLALEYARKAERMTDAGESPQKRMRVMDLLASALEKSNKLDEAKDIRAKSDQLYDQAMKPFKPEKFAGRKGQSDRAVLVELFTGAQCGPCVAADLAFDALGKTYAASEVVLLEYHVHNPAPDALANEDTDARSKYYDDEIQGTPAILFNGKTYMRAEGGGPVDLAKERYQGYLTTINPLLERTTPVKIKAKAARKGDMVDVGAEVSGLEVTGDKVRLRFVLVEDVVRYRGTNGIRIHHHVVRAMPGGAEGFALPQKTGKHEITVDLKHLRESLNKYLRAYGRQRPFPTDERPLALKDLHLITFVQHDTTKEVLQAVQVPVNGATAEK